MNKSILYASIAEGIVNAIVTAILVTLIASAKTWPVTKKLRALAMTQLSTKALIVIGAVIFFAASTYELISRLREPGPPSRLDVFVIVLATINFFSSIFVLMVALDWAKTRKPNA